MRPVLRQFLHDLRKINGREKVPPGVIGNLLDFFLVLLTIG
jgi:hypothetical protein